MYQLAETDYYALRVLSYLIVVTSSQKPPICYVEALFFPRENPVQGAPWYRGGVYGNCPGACKLSSRVGHSTVEMHRGKAK